MFRAYGYTGGHVQRCRTRPRTKPRTSIGRDFTAPAVNQRYVGDITYLPVGERGFLYLATVIDLHSRRLAAGRSPITFVPI